MSSHVVVIATDLRRSTIKVSPGTYLIDVLQEACKKLNLSSDKYLLKHKQRPVDLSVPLRTSGLLPGAKLELVQKSNTPSAVQIALQLPQPEASEIPGGRLIRKFPSDLTLWKLLRQFESGEANGGKNVNITARGIAAGLEGGRGSGQLYYETPVLNIMGRELSTFADFQKTLSQLGHNSGNVLIRLSYRKTQQTLFEAMEEISQFFKEAGGQNDKLGDSTTSDSKPQDETPAQAQDTVMADAAPAPLETSETQKPLEQQSPMGPAPQQPPQESVSNDTASRDPYQPVNVFLAPTGSAPAAALAPAEEEDFAPTIAHAQLHQARLLKSSRNKRLLSDKELSDKAAADAARVAAIKSILVKVRFPDNTSSEWQVGPEETGAFLHEAVRQVMASRGHVFRLVLPGSKAIIHDDGGPRHSLIKGYKLASRVLVNLVWDDGVPLEARKQPFLKADVAQRGQAVKIPELPSAQDAGEPSPSLQPQPPRPDKGDGKGDGAGKKIPKWLKLGKK
ncbi:GLUT4 regulating protein TUG [Ophiocordyceps sinensis CO18]|uniref:GLUT4 regulating protein TUG n=1 Tax=Ophiocordyceps sinensis (strain Co18 / CGMCC 3.14243) TaxID=911162 RepID=T5AHX5_OPHSC|nr:GLUT4 regulating protein TUG [Ophiocordyceps sinensis CO18]